MIHLILTFVLIFKISLLVEISIASNDGILAKWVDMLENRSFIKTEESDFWFEYLDGFEFSKFKFLRYDNENVILESVDRHFFVKISENSSFWGENQNDISIIFGNGYWEIPIEKNKQQLVFAKWVDENGERIFLKLVDNPMWIEYSYDKLFAEWDLIGYDPNWNAIIYDKGRNFYVKITNEHLLWGSSKDQIDNVFGDGHWEIMPGSVIS